METRPEAQNLVRMNILRHMSVCMPIFISALPTVSISTFDHTSHRVFMYSSPEHRAFPLYSCVRKSISTPFCERIHKHSDKHAYILNKMFWTEHLPFPLHHAAMNQPVTTRSVSLSPGLPLAQSRAFLVQSCRNIHQQRAADWKHVAPHYCFSPSLYKLAWQLSSSVQNAVLFLDSKQLLTALLFDSAHGNREILNIISLSFCQSGKTIITHK